MHHHHLFPSPSSLHPLDLGGSRTIGMKMPVYWIKVAAVTLPWWWENRGEDSLTAGMYIPAHLITFQARKRGEKVMKESGKDWTDCLTTRLEGGVGRGKQNQRQGETERTCFYLKWAPVFFNKSGNEDTVPQGIYEKRLWRFVFAEYKPCTCSASENTSIW